MSVGDSEIRRFTLLSGGDAPGPSAGPDQGLADVLTMQRPSVPSSSREAERALYQDSLAEYCWARDGRGPATPSRELPRLLRTRCSAGGAAPPRSWALGLACTSKLSTSSADYYTSDESRCQRRADWYGMRCGGGVERVGEGGGTRLLCDIL
ncbi:hypothetical protein SMALB_0029 [Streptomyces malaysiensis]|uniref:Uncharacterized protein n=1 Tax=Streptomyces malaysiensis TaxID=92644 RepID=A0A7X6ATU1_STRMQ|nr:hypothetical protein [Streptomyces malaysiensis]